MIALWLALPMAFGQAPAPGAGRDLAPTAHANPSGPGPSDFDQNQTLPPDHPDVAPAAGGDPADPSAPALSSKDLLKRLDEMKAELKSRPKSAEIEFALGNLYYENARWPDAIDSYRELLTRAEGPLTRYLALRQKPHQDVSAEDAHCGTGGRPTFQDLIAGAEARAAQGNPSAALTCYAAALLPITMALTRQGNAWYLLGNDDAAIADHEKALTLVPDDPDSLFFLGAILLETGDGDLDKLKRAKGYWQHFLKVNQEPERQKLVSRDILKVQQALDNHGRLPAAPGEGMPPQMRAMAVGPIVPAGPAPTLSDAQRHALAAAVAKGQAALDAKQWPSAQAAFAEARKLDRADPSAARGEGIALLHQGKRLDAEAALRDGLGRNPDDALALFELGEVFFENEHYAGAAKFWTMVQDQDPALAKQLQLAAKLAAAQQAQ